MIRIAKKRAKKTKKTPIFILAKIFCLEFKIKSDNDFLPKNIQILSYSEEKLYTRHFGGFRAYRIEAYGKRPISLRGSFQACLKSKIQSGNDFQAKIIQILSYFEENLAT